MMTKLVALMASVAPSRIKVAIYRACGMRIAKDVRIGFGTILLCSDVDLAAGATIGQFCLIRAASLRLGKRAAIQNLVRISVHSLWLKSQATICSQNEISGDVSDEGSQLTLGAATWILPHCFIDVSRAIRLGRNVGVGGGSYLFTHGLWLSRLDGFPVSFGGIVIEDDVWLPWGCFVMPNVVIGAGSIVGARAVVNKSLPAGVLAAGVPAKVLRDKAHEDLTLEDKARILEELSTSYARKERLQLRRLTFPTHDDHLLGSVHLLRVHKLQGREEYLPWPSLNVITRPLPADLPADLVVWSLDGYASTSYDTMPLTIRRWFSHARRAGVRFYPVDEDDSLRKI